MFGPHGTEVLIHVSSKRHCDFSADVRMELWVEGVCGSPQIQAKSSTPPEDLNITEKIVAIISLNQADATVSITTLSNNKVNCNFKFF